MSKDEVIRTLTVDELLEAELTIAKMVQQESFPLERLKLQRKGMVSTKSKLFPLNPFLDTNGLIRIGGRIQQSNMSWEQQHPIILPSGHFITNLLMYEEHVRLLHCGPEQLLSSIRQKYWPLSGRREAKKIKHNCIKCYRMRPSVPDAIMGNLPRERVTEGSRPFINCGVDYAGPLQYRTSQGRERPQILKAYIAVFTCLSTKAVHLELVTQLTTECFLAALKRFTSRRGLCAQIFSDNGTNFVGANKELQAIYEFLRSNNATITEDLAAQKISWKFIPPRTAHFGGLWEAAVKIAKRHLYTVTQGLVLNFEEVYTLLTQIEAVMNSRPLIPLSSDPQDLSVLTPAHFIIGDSLTSPVEYYYLDTADNRLSRWEHLQKVRQHFWQRWQREYLHQLQTRHKWNIYGTNIQPGALVLLQEDNTAPLHWPLGRIIDVHPGLDGVVRVASVKTARGIYKRPVKKLSLLPIH